jgi:pSer/pThr/pTyr-binding forkhead associated (FHA) protein
MNSFPPPGDPDDATEGLRPGEIPPLPFPSLPSERTPTLRELSVGGDLSVPPPPLPFPLAAPDRDVTPFRPSQRPPIALLCIVDDGQEDGEIVRLRADRYVFGRVEGDVVIPHDSLISSRHAELTRHLDRGRTVWYLRDLGSTNGSYVRIITANVESGQKMLIGGRHYRFDDPLQSAVKAAEAEDEAPGTRRALGGGAPSLLPQLVALTEKGDGQRYQIGQTDCWVGRDTKRCGVVLADDPMVSPQHVRLFRDSDGHWKMQDGKSRNGTWFRIHKVRFKRTSQFMLGEQRFVLRFLP